MIRKRGQMGQPAMNGTRYEKCNIGQIRGIHSFLLLALVFILATLFLTSLNFKSVKFQHFFPLYFQCHLKKILLII